MLEDGRSDSIEPHEALESSKVQPTVVVVAKSKCASNNSPKSSMVTCMAQKSVSQPSTCIVLEGARNHVPVPGDTVLTPHTRERLKKRTMPPREDVVRLARLRRFTCDQRPRAQL